jgi:uncharacterized repeat protein (TIGR01451 family)
MSRRAISVLVLALLPGLVPAQVKPSPLPACGPSPLLFVRFLGPRGMKVALYPGAGPAREYAAPVSAGLRPGYIYRVKLSGLADHPAVALYPSLEVRGSLLLPPKLNAADFPAPVVFTDQDIHQALCGTLVTKVIYLEHPDKAPPQATKQDQPIETDLPAGQDPLRESFAFGRPMVIVRLGERELTEGELAAQAVPGTLLLPGGKSLPWPNVAPSVPWACFRFYDPIVGPRPPEEECLHDGGDVGQPVGLDREGNLHGLDPSDSVAEYTDSAGRRRLAISNRVCVCVPRFAVFRTETPLAAYGSALGLAASHAQLGQGQVQMRLPSLQTQQYDQLGAMRSRLRPSGAIARVGAGELLRVEVLQATVMNMGLGALLGTEGIAKLTELQRTELTKQIELTQQFGSSASTRGVGGSLGTAVVGRVDSLKVTAGVAETRDCTVACNQAPRPPDKPLCLFKWANAKAARVGDVVTFHLKYSNQGGRPISDVAVSDSLPGRLEYVTGTARSDRGAVFTTQENEAGSVIVHWEIDGQLLPGQSGVVSFQAKVR